MDESPRTITVLVSGPTPAAREALIADMTAPDSAASDASAIRTAVILEGLSDGKPRLTDTPDLHVVRVAPGCMCCTGNLIMRVTLNRILRERPQHLYIGISPLTHIQTLQELLSAAPYDALLDLRGDGPPAGLD